MSIASIVSNLVPGLAAAAAPSAWTETDMLARVLASDAVGWKELMRRYRPLVYRCVGKVMARHGVTAVAELDEVFADVMMQLVRDDMHKLRMYDPARGTKLSSWIGMISVNAAFDYLRAIGRRASHEPLMLDADQLDERADDSGELSPLETLLEKERWRQLNELLTDFTDKDRTFVALYYGQGLPAEQIAAEMQISLKTVYSKKHKIRAHLVRLLERLAPESPIADLGRQPLAA